ncbi:S8 family serine peptidase [Nocardioides sp. SOB77]|uniref:S8 family serine peptidase n=1 Tax=Nocardioides oceani TaxID=3058369 RepID=A0ABT8FH36_9ACTN|nr:S8 family serine peptidase [Nocardioides oceani]MDN4173844.1 S8 family serine peptidase [Nocardioides oceani]
MRPSTTRVRRVLAAALALPVLVVPALAATGSPASGDASDAPDAGGRLHLVTLAGPGVAGYRGPLPDSYVRVAMLREQDALLESVGAPATAYRWTTTLNGFAARLTPAQVGALRADPDVVAVERDEVRPLAGVPARGAAAAPRGRRTGGPAGSGVVIGVVDSGLAPESPVFSGAPRLGRAPDGFGGACVTAEDWPAERCTRKVVGARWFVRGFGEDAVRAGASLSPRDDDGHGTRSASIAAGNSGVTVRVGERRVGRYSGVAPQARLAVYKACWTAPDPSDDGCATSDLVAAVDQAVADGVDVLSLAVAGGEGYDALERALLGAAEADVVVVAAAGNDARTAYAAHPGPWVTTVGGAAGPQRRGRVVLAGGPTLLGASSAGRPVGPTRVVRGAEVAAPSASPARARACAPGSLDAGAVAGRIVLCARGGHVPRLEKSRAVELADGAGMVLVNVAPGSTDADFHHVPTVHLDRRAARLLGRRLDERPGLPVALRPDGTAPAAERVLPWSSAGDPAGDLVKPDVVAPASGLLGAVPAAGRPAPWDLSSGTSAATAYTAGVAALLRQRHPSWSAAAVRSALATTAGRLDAPVLRAGAGRVRPGAAVRPGLVHLVEPGDYRAWLDGDLRGDLNTPSVLLRGGETRATRTITNVTGRARYFSSRVTGFGRRVQVRPAAVRLGPGASATYTVTVLGAGPDEGHVVWLGGSGTLTRVPVVVSGR